MGFSTLFPPIPRTVWHPGDPEIECHLGEVADAKLHTAGAAGLVMRGPRITLDAGLYGVEFQMALDVADLPAGQEIATVEVMAGSGSILLAGQVITAGELAGEFGGMYQGVRLDVIVEGRLEDVEFRIVASGQAALQIKGIKLVPRPGLIWFPSQLEPNPRCWRVASDRSASATGPQEMCTPRIMLTPGDYRAGIKMKPPAGMTTGEIAAIQVSGTAGSSGSSHIVVADPSVTAEGMLANHGVPDAKLRFRLAEACAVELQVEALVTGLTVQWLRLATADEAVWHHYFNLGGNRSALGEPVGAFLTTLSPLSGVQGSYRRFEHGLIVWTTENGPCEIMGGIARYYESHGGISGPLGFPTGRPKYLPGETVQMFEVQMVKSHA